MQSTERRSLCASFNVASDATVAAGFWICSKPWVIHLAVLMADFV